MSVSPQSSDGKARGQGQLATHAESLRDFSKKQASIMIKVFRTLSQAEARWG